VHAITGTRLRGVIRGDKRGSYELAPSPSPPSRSTDGRPTDPSLTDERGLLGGGHQVLLR